MGRLRTLILAVALTSAVAGVANACEPVWVRPISRDGAVLSLVQAVRWWKGEIVVAPVNPAERKRAAKTIKFNNVPLTCAWQTFRKGERVYVVDDWAAPISEVSFLPARGR
jgi:hypothetical protein